MERRRSPLDGADPRGTSSRAARAQARRRVSQCPVVGHRPEAALRDRDAGRTPPAAHGRARRARQGAQGELHDGAHVGDLAVLRRLSAGEAEEAQAAQSPAREKVAGEHRGVRENNGRCRPRQGARPIPGPVAVRFSVVGNRRVILALGLALAGANVAHADEVDDLEAKGQELAKQSEDTQAIAAFKQADARRPRAAHACMIGLAYMRREAWPQAELFLALCEKRAAPGDQPPDWTDEAEKQPRQKLSAAQIPAVTIDVSPANVGARLTVSSFAPDEVFDPQTL